jgi:cobyrinic acid a,c-diamide synthase
MTITRKVLARKLIDYLQHRVTLAELVDWAETALLEAKLDERDIDTLREVLARIGLADVRAFSLTWEDCEDFLSRLGYHVDLRVSEAA